ncbi:MULTISPECIES: hypothetical protein [unclassified Bradyrhizobium]|uniref:hypothetical protein n=1 Tax=unclassified Bradyrhizobium TaxID=2631580 RepID=UPI0015CCDB79|nr:MULTISPECIES: hypothetical protein [unclassified Bradyrhizobium]MBB4259722.1 phage shock protein A [Bradyrhizobium sp. CIR3A]NYG47578.1 phage shock protein A [Bradyrhizobium sp. IAR9]
MAPLKKKTADEFVVPSLIEASPEHAGLVAKHTELQTRYNELNAERALLRRDVKAAKEAEASGKKPISLAVAKLLGDNAEESVASLSKKLREVSAEMANNESATEILRRRLDESRNAASKIVCGTVLQEYRRRLSALCEVALALEAARQDVDELLDRLDVEDVNKSYLRPIAPHFMGDRREGKVFYFLREVKEAHNV